MTKRFGSRTPYAKWTSVMAKVDNQVAKEKEARTKRKSGKR